MGKLWKYSGFGLPDLPHFCQELRHSVWTMDDREGLNLPIPPVKTRSVPILSNRHDGRVTGDTPKDIELCQAWPPLGPPPPK